MSSTLRAAALFTLIALAACACFLALDLRVSTRPVAADEPGPGARRSKRTPATVVVAPPVTQSAGYDDPFGAPENLRKRSFFNPLATRADELPEESAPELFPLASPDAPDDAAPQFSVWAKFPVGSWSRTRVAAQTLENGKKVESVTETRATLMNVDLERKRYTLRYDSTIKMGGVDHPRAPEFVEFNFWDEVADDDEIEENRAPVNLMIDDRAVPCRVKRLIRKSGRGREIVTIWYSPVTAPYVLQRETTRETSGGAAREIASRELYVVQKATATTPYAAAHAGSEALFSKAFGTRDVAGSSLRSTTIPGGVVHEKTVEKDSEEDAQPYQSETSLLDYYIAS